MLFPKPDDAAVDLVLRVANGEYARFHNRELDNQADALQSEYAALVERAFEPSASLADPEFEAVVKRVRESAPLQLEILHTEQGYRLMHWRVVDDLRFGLDWCVLMLLDVSLPYRQARCRCAHCKKFYIARRNPKGGPANRIYCSTECRDEAHAAGREIRRARAARKAARKHK